MVLSGDTVPSPASALPVQTKFTFAEWKQWYVVLTCNWAFCLPSPELRCIEGNAFASPQAFERKCSTHGEAMSSCG